MDDPTLDPILGEIEAFLTETGRTPTAFGYDALKDPTLVHELRRGRECRRATRERIRQFIKAERGAAGSSAPAPDRAAPEAA